MRIRSRLRLLVLCAALATAAVVATGTAASAHEKQTVGDHRVPALLFAGLSGAEEIAPDGSPGAGDPDGRGFALVLVKDLRVCALLLVRDITLPAAAAHIHSGARGVNGPVVVTLTPPGAHGISLGCTTVDADLAGQIADEPAQFYVNVHTSDFPAGAVRGNLHGF
jgi:hypothetical protein